MKYILFLIFTTGAAPVAQEHYFATTAEFDDRVTCEAVLEGFKRMPRYRIEGLCAPKSADGLQPDARKRLEEKFPPLSK